MIINVKLYSLSLSRSLSLFLSLSLSLTYALLGVDAWLLLKRRA
jgi:uncharacterized membrane protein